MESYWAAWAHNNGYDTAAKFNGWVNGLTPLSVTEFPKAIQAIIGALVYCDGVGTP